MAMLRAALQQRQRGAVGHHGLPALDQVSPGGGSEDLSPVRENSRDIPGAGGTPHTRRSSGFNIKADTATLIGVATPQAKRNCPAFVWLLDFKKSPLQPTARLSPCTFLLRLLLVFLIFMVISSTLPVGAVSEATVGVNLFVQELPYQRLTGHDGTLSTVTTLDDVVLYQRALVTALLPIEAYGNQSRSEVPYLLRVDRLINSIVVAQRRVDGTNCAYENMQSVYPECFGGLDEDEHREPFAGHPYDDGLGGIHAKMPLRRDEALHAWHRLEAEHFWDRATREATVRFAFFNANGPFTGYCIVKFTLSPYGNVGSEVETRWLRLQPYAKEANGGQLVFYQVATLLLLFLLLLETVFHAYHQPHVRYRLAYLLRPFAMYDFFILVTVYFAFDAWVTYISGPNRRNFDPESPQFTKIAGLADEFGAFLFYMSLLVLLVAVRLSEFMVLQDDLANIYVSVANALGDMGMFGFFFAILFSGFVLAGHVLFGTEMPMFSSLGTTASHLMLWLLGLGGGYRELFTKPGGLIYLGLFIFVCLILILNILMALVLVAFDPSEKEALKVMKFTEKDRPFNHHLADSICDVCQVSEFNGDLYRGHSMDSDEDGDGTYDDDDVEKAPLIARPTQEEDA